MASVLERPATSGLWHELTLGQGRRRLLIGFVASVLGPIAITPLVDSLEGPAGLYLLALVPAALIGRLWPALVAAIGSAILQTVYIDPPNDLTSPQTEDWIVLALFVGLAVLLSTEEAARARARAGQDRLAFLAEANRVLTTSLDSSQTISDLTRLAVPRVADWCFIALRSPGEGTLEQHIAHPDPEKSDFVRALREKYPPNLSDPSSPLVSVLRTGRSRVIPKVTEELIRSVASDNEHLRILKELGLHSALLVALTGPQGPIGALALIQAESDRRFTDADLPFAEELARTASMAIENARLHQERTRIAQTLQNSLLPSEIPDIPGLEVAVRYRPAGEGNLVGGDFFDVFDAGGGSWAVALGDVCGKGPEAAALTGLVRHTIRTAAARERRPSAILSIVNRQILKTNGDRFCTATMGTVESSNGVVKMKVSCGGHPAPLVIRASRTVEETDCLGTLLGVFPDADLIDSPVELGPGDAIVFYTDGVTEQFGRNGTAGDAHLVSLLWDSEGLDATTIADRIYREAALEEEDAPRDDMAIVVLRVPAAAAS
ncbi:MAG: SpoIIE family protein phosphatase [Actinomycetota bacterium]